LVTLFAKDTPTHDGGLLIRKGRATHCGAVFPLSGRKQIENGLGTRHRAAIGLTEKTDAVCLVVSEEEGTISLAKEGELLYAIPAKEVEGKMEKLLSGKNRARYYPFHYIKRLAPKLAQANYIRFSTSLGERIFELSAAVFWFAMILLSHRIGISPFAALGEPILTLLNAPWIYIPYASFALSMIALFSSRVIAANGALNQVKIENRLFFLPFYRRRFSAKDLESIRLKHERTSPDLWSLRLLTRNRKSLLIDRSTAGRKLTETAKKIRDVLRIELAT